MVARTLTLRVMVAVPAAAMSPILTVGLQPIPPVMAAAVVFQILTVAQVLTQPDKAGAQAFRMPIVVPPQTRQARGAAKERSRTGMAARMLIRQAKVVARCATPIPMSALVPILLVAVKAVVANALCRKSFAPHLKSQANE